MRTDAAIHRDVVAELLWDPAITHQGITVAVKDGVVALGGILPSYAEKVAAERAAGMVAGVRAVAEEIEVRLPTAFEVADQALAGRAANALDWAAPVPHGTVKPRVERGWITLEGTVEYGFQRASAEAAVRNLSGVRGVTNDIKIEPPRLSPATVKGDIETALKRHAELDASGITVEAREGTVTLRGAVHSWAERGVAERAAWNAPGVKMVDDRLAVTTT